MQKQPFWSRRWNASLRTAGGSGGRGRWNWCYCTFVPPTPSHLLLLMTHHEETQLNALPQPYLILTLKPRLVGYKSAIVPKKFRTGAGELKSKINNRTRNLQTSWEPLTGNVCHAWWILLRQQSINCLVRISFAIKNEVGGRIEAKKIRFFEKNICILPVGYLTSSADALSTTNVSSK